MTDKEDEREQGTVSTLRQVFTHEESALLLWVLVYSSRASPNCDPALRLSGSSFRRHLCLTRKTLTRFSRLC